MTRIYILSVALLFAAFTAACTQMEDLYSPASPGSELQINVALVSSQAWESRAERSMSGEAVEMIGEGNFMIFGTKGEWRTDTTAMQSPVTRGTPLTSASAISNIRINVYNTKTADWTTSATQTAEIVATNTSGGYTTSPSYNWLTDASAKTTLFAYSPVPTSANGLTDITPNKITYTVPTTVANQPDLCTAPPAMDIVNADGTQQVRTFALSHRLTAVGFSMLAWNLKISKITVSGVYVTGTLTMNTSGTPTWATSGSTGSRDVGVTGSSYQHTINSSYADITSSNGYLMMIPQTLTDDATVTITYVSTATGSTGGTLTAKLKDLGVTWEAGDKITYYIRLKTAPAVTSGDLTIANDLAGYTTSSPLTFLMDSRDNLTFTWNADWLKIHRGNPKTGDTSGGAVSGWSTGAGGPWSNIYFFATSANTSITADRTATVIVTGTRSGSKTFNVKQVKAPPYIYLTDNEADSPFLISVKSQESTSTMIWGPNGATGATDIYDGKGNTNKIMALSTASQYAAAQYCRNQGSVWNLPAREQLMMMWIYLPAIDGDIAYTSSKAYWSSTESYNNSFAWFVSFRDGSMYSGGKSNKSYVRCVREK